MKAIQFVPGRGAVLSEIDIPSISKDEVLVKVSACGLCGSDLLKLDGADTGSSVIGHEVAGTVAAVGRSVRALKRGDRVAAAHHAPCGRCHYCRSSNHSMCPQFKATNFYPGGFAEYIRVGPEHVRSTVLKIPPRLDAARASLAEPLSCCVRNMRRLALRRGDAAVVVGLGSIGLMTAQLARLAGALALGVDTDPRRRGMAEETGIESCDPARAAARVSKLTAGRGADAVVVTAGGGRAVGAALTQVRDGGKVCLFGGFPSTDESPVDLGAVYHREITLMGSYSSSPADLREALRLIAACRIDVGPFVREVYRLEDFGEAVDKFRSREILKAIIVMNGKGTDI